MMDSHTLRAVNDSATRDARNRGSRPLLLTEADVISLRDHGRLPGGRRIPYVGDRAPRGWHRQQIAGWFPESSGEGWNPKGYYSGANRDHGGFFVDISGLGGTGEPALTMEEFGNLIRPGYGYAVVEAGQFQAHVGVFRLVGKEAKARAEAAAAEYEIRKLRDEI